MKIVYCLNSIDYVGGVEVVTVQKANMLADVPGNEVYILVTDYNGTRDFELSSKVKLIDLEINYFKHESNKLSDFFVQSQKKKKHFQKLKETLNKIQPDIVISTGWSEKHKLPFISGKWRTIREIHNEKKFRHKYADSFLGGLRAYISDFVDYGITIKKYDRIVVLTNEDKMTNWSKNSKVIVVPNPCRFEPLVSRDNWDCKNIISAGRLAKQKNFASLIRAFKFVHNVHPDWTLTIYGEGPQRLMLEELADSLGLKDYVHLPGISENIKEKMLDSSIFVLSSIYEGFALVLLEGMSCGLPIVSYSCPCGPKDLISEGENGYLLPVNDEQGLANAINNLIEDENKRRTMGREGLLSVLQYSPEIICDRWMGLFKELSEI